MDHARICAAAGRLLNYADELEARKDAHWWNGLADDARCRLIAATLRHEAREVLRGAAPDPGPGQPDPAPSGSGQSKADAIPGRGCGHVPRHVDGGCGHVPRPGTCGDCFEARKQTECPPRPGQAGFCVVAKRSDDSKLALLSWADGEIERLVAELLASDRLLSETAGQIDAVANSLDDVLSMLEYSGNGERFFSAGKNARQGHEHLVSCIRKLRRLPALYETVQETGKEQGT